MQTNLLYSVDGNWIEYYVLHVFLMGKRLSYGVDFGT